MNAAGLFSFNAINRKHYPMQLLETDLSPENLAYKDEICRLSLLALNTKNVPVLKRLSTHKNEHIRAYVAGNPHTPYKVLVALVQDTNPYVLSTMLQRKKIPFTVLLLLGSFDSPYFLEAIRLQALYHLQVKKHLKGWRFYKKKIVEKYKNRTDKRQNTVAFIC